MTFVLIGHSPKSLNSKYRRAPKRLETMKNLDWRAEFSSLIYLLNTTASNLFQVTRSLQVSDDRLPSRGDRLSLFTSFFNLFFNLIHSPTENLLVAKFRPAKSQQTLRKLTLTFCLCVLQCNFRLGFSLRRICKRHFTFADCKTEHRFSETVEVLVRSKGFQGELKSTTKMHFSSLLRDAHCCGEPLAAEDDKMCFERFAVPDQRTVSESVRWDGPNERIGFDWRWSLLIIRSSYSAKG